MTLNGTLEDFSPAGILKVLSDDGRTGAVRFAASGPVHAMYLCHCSRCRKETGTAHAANIFLRDATLTWTRGGDSVRHYALPGTRKARSFCTTCGSPVARAAGATMYFTGVRHFFH